MLERLYLTVLHEDAWLTPFVVLALLLLIAAAILALLNTRPMAASLALLLVISAIVCSVLGHGYERRLPTEPFNADHTPSIREHELLKRHQFRARRVLVVSIAALAPLLLLAVSTLRAARTEKPGVRRTRTVLFLIAGLMVIAGLAVGGRPLPSRHWPFEARDFPSWNIAAALENHRGASEGNCAVLDAGLHGFFDTSGPRPIQRRDIHPILDGWKAMAFECVENELAHRNRRFTQQAMLESALLLDEDQRVRVHAWHPPPPSHLQTYESDVY